MSARMFPIMDGGPSIPWEMIAPHEAQSWEWFDRFRSLTIYRHAERSGSVRWTYHALNEDTGGEWKGEVPSRKRVVELWEWLNDNDPETEP